jgi:hypothetical protein
MRELARRSANVDGVLTSLTIERLSIICISTADCCISYPGGRVHSPSDPVVAIVSSTRYKVKKDEKL